MEILRKRTVSSEFRTVWTIQSVSTKLTHQENRWNFGILRSGGIYIYLILWMVFFTKEEHVFHWVLCTFCYMLQIVRTLLYLVHISRDVQFFITFTIFVKWFHYVLWPLHYRNSFNKHSQRLLNFKALCILK